MAKSRVPPATLPSANNKHIPTPAKPAAEMLLSFKHLKITDKYTPAGRETDYFVVALERLREACQVSPQEMKQAGKAWRCHVIKWDDTSEPKGYDLMPQALRDSEPMQIGLGKSDGRIHGFFVGQTFYVVWFDAHHRLYPGR